MNTKELTQAVQILMEREEQRLEADEQERLDQLQKQREDIQHRRLRQQDSIEVIKWCVVAITSVVAVSVIVVVFVVLQVRQEAVRIKSEVQRIQHEAEIIRDKIRHPLESIGGSLGKRIDGRLNEMIGIESTSE